MTSSKQKEPSVLKLSVTYLSSYAAAWFVEKAGFPNSVFSNGWTPTIFALTSTAVQLYFGGIAPDMHSDAKFAILDGQSRYTSKDAPLISR